VFEYGYESPEAQRVRIRFEEIQAEYRADHDRTLTADEQRDKAYKELVAQNEKADEENRKKAEALRSAQAVAAEPSPWTAPREVATTMSFGEFQDEDQSSSWSNPTPPMGFPPPPPIPDPIPDPEQFRNAPEQPLMSFGDFEDDEPAARPTPPPPPPPRPGRRRLREDDDEDMSGQSWLS
jgi:hypothetical protein